MKRSEAIELRHKIEHASALQSDEDAVESINFYPSWKPGMDVHTGERYKYKEDLWKVLLDHRTQADWKPDIAPSLFVKISIEEWPEWVQPLGAQDAYAKDAKVSHNGNHWTSIYDNNVWEPGVYGWALVPNNIYM